jgi:hydrogenase maturation protease
VVRTLIVGLGNPLLGDDGVGWRVAEEVQKRLNPSPLSPVGRGGGGEGIVEIDFHSGGGLSLMERLVGYGRAVIVDAVNLGYGPIGSVYRLSLESLPNPSAGHLGSAHETNLRTALELGRRMGAPLPKQVMIVAVESPYVYDFSESLTPPVAAAVPVAVQMVLDWLEA